MKPIALGMIICCFLLTSALSQELGSGIKIKVRDRADDYHDKYALIVGINYGNCKPELNLKLTNAENDARAISQLLAKSYGFRCETLLGDQAKAGSILAKLKKIANQVGEMDCFLFYFAGHGKPRNDDVPVLYPADIEADGLIANELPASELVRPEIRARHSLYLFDSCFSGQIVDLGRHPPLLNQTKPRQGPGSFDGRSIQIMTSTTRTQKASDGHNDGEHGNSPFTETLKAGFNKDRLTVTELYEQIKESLKGQEPILTSLVPVDNATSGGGEFHFVGKAPEPVVARLTLQTLPGSVATFAGSAHQLSWFDETPWLTPRIRLRLDQDAGQSMSYEFPAQPSADPNLSEFLIKRKLEITKGALEIDAQSKVVFDILSTLEGSSERAAIINMAVASRQSTRDPAPNAVELHLNCLLDAARLKYRDVKPEAIDIEQLHKQFREASEVYAASNLKGLHARLLADYAAWLLANANMDSKNNAEAQSQFEQALRLVGVDGLELFRIELHSGAAYAARNWAKDASLSDEMQQNGRDAFAVWEVAAAHYAQAIEIADKSTWPGMDRLKAYLFERCAWLSMDLWKIAEAERYFRNAVQILERSTHEHDSTSADLNSFLSYASCTQGLAMAGRFSGRKVDDELKNIQGEIYSRLRKPSTRKDEVMVLHQRLGNTTERLADCYFLSGRSGMEKALEVYDQGLKRMVDLKKQPKTILERDAASVQRMRFLSKSIIAAALTDNADFLKLFEKEFDNSINHVSAATGLLKVLCELAKEFSRYATSRKDGEAAAIQESLDRIRKIVQQNTKPSLDREQAELLMMVTGVLSDEQRRLDAMFLKNLLPFEPNDPDRNPPKEMSSQVRNEYDRVILMQGESYHGRVASPPEFRRFRDQVLAVRQSDWSAADRNSPFVLFFFPLDGSNGLIIWSFGKLKSGEVHRLDFGYKEIGTLSDSVKSDLSRFELEVKIAGERPKIGWNDDAMLSSEGKDKFPVSCPFATLNVGL